MKQEYTFWIGSYRAGVCKLSFEEDGRNACVTPEAPVRRVGYLAQQGRALYALTESPGASGLPGELTTFRAADGALIKLAARQDLEPVMPHLTLTDGMLYACSYGVGTVDAVSLLPGGIPGARTQTLQLYGSSVNSVRQTCPHPHSVWVCPDGRALYVCDLGTDTLEVFSIEEDRLRHLPAASVHTAPGEGPRHLAFHPEGKSSYLLTEMGYSIYILDLTDCLAPMRMGRVDACPGLPQEQRGGAAIRVSPDGKFLYCSNRSDSGGRIDWFSIEDPMHPQHAGTVSDGLFFPRDFALSRDGQYLVSTGQREETIILWKRNAQTGALSKLRTISNVPEPVCVLDWKETS